MERIKRVVIINTITIGLIVSLSYGEDINKDSYYKSSEQWKLEVVVGQTDVVSNSSGCSARELYGPTSVCSDGTRLYISDSGNNRVLIYNTIPTSNGPPADVVVGQTDMNSNSFGCSATKLYWPKRIDSDGSRLYIVDGENDQVDLMFRAYRVLIYNTIPTESGSPADVVVGQADMNSNVYGDLEGVTDVCSDGMRLYITTAGGALIYNTIPTNNGVSADIGIGVRYGFHGVYSDGMKLYIADTDKKL